MGSAGSITKMAAKLARKVGRTMPNATKMRVLARGALKSQPAKALSLGAAVGLPTASLIVLQNSKRRQFREENEMRQSVVDNLYMRQDESQQFDRESALIDALTIMYSVDLVATFIPGLNKILAVEDLLQLGSLGNDLVTGQSAGSSYQGSITDWVTHSAMAIVNHWEKLYQQGGMQQYKMSNRGYVGEQVRNWTTPVEDMMKGSRLHYTDEEVEEYRGRPENLWISWYTNDQIREMMNKEAFENRIQPPKEWYDAVRQDPEWQEANERVEELTKALRIIEERRRDTILTPGVALGLKLEARRLSEEMREAKEKKKLVESRYPVEGGKFVGYGDKFKFQDHKLEIVVGDERKVLDFGKLDDSYTFPFPGPDGTTLQMTETMMAALFLMTRGYADKNNHYLKRMTGEQLKLFHDNGFYAVDRILHETSTSKSRVDVDQQLVQDIEDIKGKIQNGLGDGEMLDGYLITPENIDVLLKINYQYGGPIDTLATYWSLPKNERQQLLAKYPNIEEVARMVSQLSESEQKQMFAFLERRGLNLSKERMVHPWDGQPEPEESWLAQAVMRHIAADDFAGLTRELKDYAAFQKTRLSGFEWESQKNRDATIAQSDRYLDRLEKQALNLVKEEDARIATEDSHQAYFQPVVDPSVTTTSGVRVNDKADAVVSGPSKKTATIVDPAQLRNERSRVERMEKLLNRFHQRNGTPTISLPVQQQRKPRGNFARPVSGSAGETNRLLGRQLSSTSGSKQLTSVTAKPAQPAQPAV